MVKFSALPLYAITYRFLIEVYQFTAKMPREYKFSLGQSLNEDVLQLFRHIYCANTAQDKIEHLDQFLYRYELIKLQLRACSDLKIISVRQTAHFAKYMIDIGQQVGGWRKYHLQKSKKEEDCAVVR